MSWFSVAWAIFVAILLLGSVGMPLARVIGIRGFAMIGLAPAFAVTVIGGTAVVAPWIGLSWSVLPVALVTIALGLVLWGVRRATRRFEAPRPARRRPDVWLIVALVAAAALISLRIVAILGSPTAISQTFDNVFHLNAVRFVLDTGSASSLTIGRMTNPGGALGFYPAGWHALVSLVVQLTGVSIPVAVNAVTIAVSAVVWPLGVVLLTRTLFGRSPALTLAAGVVAAGIPLFPLLLMDYGVLYPYQLAVAVLPAALAATARALGIGPGVTSPSQWWWGVALLGTLPGLAVAHPGGFVGWLALSAPMAVAFVIVQWRAASTAVKRWMIAIGFVAYLAVGAMLVILLRPPHEARGWPTQRGVGEAVLDALTVSVWYLTPALVVAISVVVGIVWAVRRRSVASLTALGIYLVAVFLYVVVAALPFWQIRDAFTGPWYNNLPRLAALLPVAMVPLAAFGIACTWAWLRSFGVVRRTLAGRPRWVAAAVGLTIGAAATIAMQVGPLSPLPTAQAWTSASYTAGPDSLLLTDDEVALLGRIDQHVPEGVAIAGSPWTGASLAYALADRPVLMPHTLMEITDELLTINDGLADAELGGAVCRALDDLGVGFVLDFGPREVHGGEHVFPGLSSLSESDAVRLVDEEGDARLYEIVACRT